MNKDNKDEQQHSPAPQDDEAGEQSLVGKFRTSVSGIISNTPLSKWFRRQQNTEITSSTIRRRDEGADEDLYELQPPSKRSKLPNEKDRLNIDINDTLPSPISSVTNPNRVNFVRHFPEPIAGPSGFSAPGPSGFSSTRKVLNSSSFLLRDSLRNGDLISSETSKVDSDSEASTSGYSSHLASKAVSQESSKQTSPQENSPIKTRSLFSNSSSGRNLFSQRSSNPNPNSSLSSRGPTFNATSFGSPNFVDRTLSTKRILNSPFYSGKTVYGGASAYGRNSGRTNQELRRALKNSIKIKPVNKDTSSERGGDLQLGKTARRILDTLEQYSSPVIDAKKIPTSPRKREGILTKYTGANPYSLIREHRTASNRELQVPSVTDLLKMKQNQQKSRLQESTEAVRQIAKRSKINQEPTSQETSYKVPDIQDQEQHTGKIKSKITSVRPKPQNDEPMPQLKLNPVPLPIKEMPKFDIVLPPPPAAATSGKSLLNMPISSCKPIQSKSGDADQTTLITGQFKFSAPLVLGTCEHPIKALNNFKFSEPLVKKRRSIHPELDNPTPKNNGKNLVKNSSTFSETSLMQQFKPAQGTWECSICLIRNQPDKNKCVACETPKPVGSSKKESESPSALPAFSTFGDKFKPSSNTWECSTCMIRNKVDLTKCVACETPKPGAVFKTSGFGTQFAPPSDTWECPTCMIRNKEGVTKCVACATAKSTSAPPATSAASSFGSQFSAPASTWECPTCMIRNKNELTKCVACETSKPGSNPASRLGATSQLSNSSSFGMSTTTSSFGAKFAPPPTTWECPTCMIRNKDEAVKCVACETSRPGGSKALTNNTGAGFKKEDEWECQACMIRNKSTLNKCQCCETLKPGSTASSSTTNDFDKDKKISGFSFGVDKTTISSFTFGVPPGMQQKSTNNAGGSSSFTFGTQPVSSEASTTPSFTFGVPAANKDSSTAKTSETTPSFSFGVPKKDSDVSKTDSKQEAEPKISTTPKITFGVESTNKIDTTDGKKAETSSDNSPSSPGVKVNPLLKPSEKLPEKAKPAAAGFSFGLAASTPPKPISKTDEDSDAPSAKRKAPSSSASNTTTQSPKVPLFNFKPPTPNGEVNKVSPFASKAAAKEDVAKTAAAGFQFSFGSNSSKAATALPSAPAGLTSGVAGSSGSTDAAKTAMFKFGPANSDTPKPTPPANNGFSFGSNATAAPSFGSSKTTVGQESKPFAFGGSAPTSLTTESAKAPNFSFGSSAQPQEPAKAPSFNFGGASTTENKTSATPNFSFGGSEKSTEATKPAGLFSFGGGTGKTSAGGFGQSAVSTPAFGQAATAPATSNLFGQAVAAAKASPFGQSATGSSGFGQTASQVSNPFGQSNATSSIAPPNATPFGQSAPTSAFTFGGAASTQPQQAPQPPNGLFSTGNATNQSAGFNFGSGAGTTSSQGGFNFGPTAAAQTSSGGFNFSGSAPSFDATAKPTFNFTGGAGVQQFSATPSTEAAQQPTGRRPVRKAIRRTQVR